MPGIPDMAEPLLDERMLPSLDDMIDADVDDPYVVILYNDDYHGMDEVTIQLQKATGYEIERCIRITIEADSSGRAIAYTGSESDCERAARVLRQIRLQVETDKF